MDNESLKGLVGLGGMGLILGWVQFLKPFFSDSRLYPLLAIVSAIVLNLALFWVAPGLSRSQVVAAVIQGVMVGLAASGLYSASSTIKEGKQTDKASPT